MSDDAKLNQLVAEITRIVRKIQEFDAESIRTDGAPSDPPNLDETVEAVKGLVWSYQKINLSTLKEFPLGVLQDTYEHATEHYNPLKRTLDLKKKGKYGQSNDGIETLLATYRYTHQRLNSTILYSSLLSSDVGKAKQDFEKQSSALLKGWQEQQQESLKELQEKQQELFKKLQKTQQESDNILATLREDAAEIGISQQAVYFAKEADFHQTEQKKWFKGAIGAAVVLIATIFVGLFYLTPAEDSSTSVYFQFIIAKILLFSTVAYALFFCVKNYMAHRHNYVVNKHRQNALHTFRTLVEAGTSKHAQDIVLTQAAQCIFSPQDSGYVKRNSNDQNSLNILPIESAKTINDS